MLLAQPISSFYLAIQLMTGYELSVPGCWAWDETLISSLIKLFLESGIVSGATPLIL